MLKYVITPSNLVLNYWRVERLITSLAVNRYANAFTLCSLVLNAALLRTSFASLTLAKIRSPSREGNATVVQVLKQLVYNIYPYPVRRTNIIQVLSQFVTTFTKIKKLTNLEVFGSIIFTPSGNPTLFKY